MSLKGTQQELGRRAVSNTDLTGFGTFQYARTDMAQRGGNGYQTYVEEYKPQQFRATTKGGRMTGMSNRRATVSGHSTAATSHTQKVGQMQNLCMEFLKKTEYAIQAGSGDAEYFMGKANEAIENLQLFLMDMLRQGAPVENLLSSTDIYLEQLQGLRMAMSGSTLRRRSTRKSSGAMEEFPRSFDEAMAWITKQKSLLETASWEGEPTSIEQQLIHHQRFNSSIYGSHEISRALEDLNVIDDRANKRGLEQEYDTLKKMSNLRTEQLKDLIQIIQELNNEIIWVNEKEEEELMFDWSDKNIEMYIPKKQESYSKLMCNLEQKEKGMSKIMAKAQKLLDKDHPASFQIGAYKETLQTQWSWLLKITKCIDTHLKENVAYSQFFKEANDTNKGLQKQQEKIQTFMCDKNTSLEDLKELLKGLEMEKENIKDHKRQVKHLSVMSKNIVRLKPRNPDEKISGSITVMALTDFKIDQKRIDEGNKAILQDNRERSKWKVIGPGGLDMIIPSVCLIVPPPNPLSINLADKNEQYYEAIMTIWNQLYINVKSLIAWQYCLIDIQHVNSLTISMLSKMRPEEYRHIMKILETNYEEFKVSSHGSKVISEEDKNSIENQVTGAQAHYEKLVVELPTYVARSGQIEVQQPPEQQVQQQLFILQQQPQQQRQILLIQQEQQQQQQQHVVVLQQQQQNEHQQNLILQRQLEIQQQEAAAQEDAKRLAEERHEAELGKQVKKEAKEKWSVIKKDVVKERKAEQKRKVSTSSSAVSLSSHLLLELHTLRMNMDAAEDSLSQYVHICFGDEGVQDCGLKLIQLESVQNDVTSIRDEYVRLRARIMKELENMNDLDKSQFLQNEIGVINQRMFNLEGSSSAYVLRLQALRDMLESIARAEDIIKVHEIRLTEKETTSLTPAEVSEYMETLKNMKAELMQKKDVLTSMESELSKAKHWDSEMSSSFHRCDLMLSKFTEQVGLFSERWRRIQAQIDTRLQDLELYLPQLQQYKQTSLSITEWIEVTRKKQDTLEATKIDSIEALKDHITKQKALNTEIKAKRETLESVLRDNEACVNSIKDYEADLTSYASGLQTLLNVPIKRTMLKSPVMDLNQEAIYLQTHYIELLTLSGDYYKFLGESLKNMEELKMRNTQIDLLEEELRSFKGEMQERNDKNKSLEEAVAQFKLQLFQSQEKLLSVEEVKQTTVLQCSATKESLNSTQSQLDDLNNEVEHLKYQVGEEKRKTKMAEERYTQQQQEYESMLRKRQKELETVSWSKVEVEKSLVNKEHEIEQLRHQLAEESASLLDLQKEMSKTKTTMQSLQSNNSDLLSERDSLLLKLQRLELDKQQMQRLEEELSRLKLSLESEFRTKQHLQEENERVKRDLSYWKDQCDGKQSLIRQYDTDKDIFERENKSLKNDIERLMKELRELEEKYKGRLLLLQKELQDVTVVRQTMETELKQTREPPTPDSSSVVFDGVRKPVTAQQLLDSGVLDKPTYNQLVRGHKTVPEVSAEKKVPLKGTGPIAGVVIESRKYPGSSNKPLSKLTFTEAKKEYLLPPDSIDLLLDAQAATGHIIDPRTNQKLTVEEAYNQGVIDDEDRERLLAAEAAAVGYSGPGGNKPLSVFQAMKKGLIDKNTTLRLLQAQESVGGILDPVLSVFLPRDTAAERNLIDDNTCYALNQRPELYLDPETEQGVTYMAMKRRCKVEPHTGLLLLPVPEKVDPSTLVFDGVRKPVTASNLLDCGVIDKPTFKDLENGKKAVPEVSEEQTVNLNGTGPIAGVIVNGRLKMSLTDAKKQMLLPEECADLLLEAQAATGHIIDPKANKKLTVEEAYAKGVVDINDLDRLLASEAAAVGYKDPHVPKPIPVFQAMKKGLIDHKNGMRLLQAQESVGGILDPNISVFLPKSTAIKRNLLDKSLCQALNQSPEYYIDPETEQQISYQALKESCKIEPHTGLLLLPITERLDPSKLIFDGVRKPVTAKQLADCGVLDKPTLYKLIKGEKTVPEVSEDKKVFLKGTGSIAGITEGPIGTMSLSKAKMQNLISSESADFLLEAQAATGHIIDPMSNQKLTVEEALARGVVDKSDRDKLLRAEAAATGYMDSHTGKSLSVFEALRKGLIDKKTGVRMLQAQESAGGILDPNLSVFLPKDTAIKRNLIDEDLCRALNQNPESYLDPDTEQDASYGALKKKCKRDPHTSLMLLPIAERKDPSKLMFDGVRKPVSAQQLLECGVLDKPTFNKLIKGEKTIPEVSEDKKTFLKGTGSIAGVKPGSLEKMTFSKAKKQMLISPESADLLLEAQAATGHIIDPVTNQKLTVEEAYARRVVDRDDRDKLLEAESAAVGYKDPTTGQSLSVFRAVKKGLIDKKTGIRLLQAQESAGGILDPNLSVFLPKDTAMKRNLLDEDIYRVLTQNPMCYLDPDTEQDTTYGALKIKCKRDCQTDPMILPIAERKDPSKLMFDGVRKPVSAQQLLECGVLDKSTIDKLIKGGKTIPEVSEDKKTFLKGTGSIAGFKAGSLEKISFSKAKEQKLISPESADLLLEAQAATGHIIDPMSNQKLTVEEACTRGLVDITVRDELLAAESAAVGYKDPHTGQHLSVLGAIKKGLLDKKTGVRLLQAQESAGGILDPNLSVYLPKDTAMKHNLLDEDLYRVLNQNLECYLDPDTEQNVSYGALKKKCVTDPHTGLVLLPIAERSDPSKLIFDGVRKPVSAQQLLECGLLDKTTFNKLIKGEKTVPELSAKMKVNLKGTGPIAGVCTGLQGNISFTEAKKVKLMSEESVDLLLEAQAACGHIIDPKTEQHLTVEVACIKGVVDFKLQGRLLAAECAATGYKDPCSGKLISLFEAMKKGVIDETTGLRLLQAQDSAGGILDPNLSIFLPKNTAIKHNLLDEKLMHDLNKNTPCFLDPQTDYSVSYGALKAKCNTNTRTGLHILPVSEKSDPPKLVFQGVLKTITAQQLRDCGVLDKKTFDQLMNGTKTVSEVSVDIKIFLKGTGSIAGVSAGPVGKLSFTEAKKLKIMSSDSANMLLLAQAATGHIIDPKTNKKLTVKEACASGLVEKEDESMLVAAEAAAIGYQDPDTAKFLSVSQAMKNGIVNFETALQLLQAQESVGGILDPTLGVFLPKDIARKMDLIDEELYQSLNKSPKCYLDPDTQQPTTYVSLKKKCKSDPSSGLLLLPKPKQSVTIRGLRHDVSVIDLLDANLLNKSDVEKLNTGKLTSQDVEDRLRSYLRGSTCIAGVYDEASDKVLSIYQAMTNGLLRPGTTLELLEAQAASGFMIDPVNNLFLTVAEAYDKRLFGKEFKNKLLSAEKAVTGYKMPVTGKIISLFQAIENGLVEKGHGIRLLEAQIASGGIIDPQHSHRIDVNVAYNRGYFNAEMNKILTDENDDTKGFFDPNTEENLTYLELKKRCITDKNFGLVLLPIIDKKKQGSSQKNTVRKRRVIIVDPETNKEMTVREAHNKGYIDYNTYLELSEQECEWQEVSITASDGSMRLVITDKSTGRQYDIMDLLEKRVIDQSVVERYRSHAITITEFADIISNQTNHMSKLLLSSSSPSSSNVIPEAVGRSSVTSSTVVSTSGTSASLRSSSSPSSSNVFAEELEQSLFKSSSLVSTLETHASLSTSSIISSTSRASEASPSSSSSSTVISRPRSPTFTKTTTTKTTTFIEKSSSPSTVPKDLSDSLKQVSNVSVTLSPLLETVGDVEPVGAIFDTETVEKVSITEALNRGLVDSITAQRLLEAQACTGGIVSPTDGKRVSIEDAFRMGLIANHMATKLKPAQKAYFGFEDFKVNRKLSAAQAIKERWLPYEAGQRFMEFQVSTGGLYDPEKNCRRSMEDALKMGWLDQRTAQKLQDTKHHAKILTCPKSKLKISYKEALDNCLVEEGTAVKMLQASSISTQGISSPYNIGSAPGSKTGSRSGSQSGSRRNSLDLGSSLTHQFTSFTSFSSTK